MKTNADKIVIQSIQGSIHHPTMRGDGHWVGYDGYGRINVGTGGITYNYQIGDCCMDIPGDHVEPGVSLKNSDNGETTAFMSLACVGNCAKVISGDAKGRVGFVTGKHGGVNHVMIYFDKETLELLNINDKIAIKAQGLGLKLLDYPDVTIMNIDPSLLLKLRIKQIANGTLQVPVTTIVPAFLMGAGLGETTLMNGDYDIMCQDAETKHTYHLDRLRFGDIVFIEDHDNHHGPHYRKGAGSIGVIVHSDSFTSGHGPGVTILMTSDKTILQPLLDSSANIANILLEEIV